MSASFDQTLNSIMVTKLREISKQVSDFNTHRERILSTLSATNSLQERVRMLLDGIKSLRLVGVSFAESSSHHITRDYLQNVEKFLVQAKGDPNFDEGILHESETNSRKYLDSEKVKNEYAELFGKLLSE